MKKLFSMLIIAMFVMSMVPASFAESGSESDDGNVGLTEAEADVFTDITIVKVEVDDEEEEFTTAAQTREDVVAEIAERYSLVEADVDAILDLEVEDRESRPDDYEDASIDSTATPPMPPEKRRAEMQERIQERNEEMKERNEQFRENVKERNEQFRENAKERNEQFREDVKEQNAQLRENIKAHTEQIRERYQLAVEHYKQARERYQDAQDKVNEAREKWKACDNDDSEACEEAREKVRKNAKPFLGNSADMILQSLERVYAQVAGNEDMDPERREALLDQLEEQMAEVEAAKAEAEELNEESTDEEIKEAAEGVKNAWGHTKAKMKRAAGDHANAKLGNVVVQTEHIADRIQNTIDKLADKGYDVSSLESMQAEMEAKLALAKAEWETAVELFSNGTEEDIDETVESAHEHMKQAQEYLKEVREDLREIVKEIKGQVGSLDVDDSEDNETDDDSEDETEDESEDESEDNSTSSGNETA